MASSNGYASVPGSGLGAVVGPALSTSRLSEGTTTPLFLQNVGIVHRETTSVPQQVGTSGLKVGQVIPEIKSSTPSPVERPLLSTAFTGQIGDAMQAAKSTSFRASASTSQPHVAVSGSTSISRGILGAGGGSGGSGQNLDNLLSTSAIPKLELRVQEHGHSSWTTLSLIVLIITLLSIFLYRRFFGNKQGNPRGGYASVQQWPDTMDDEFGLNELEEEENKALSDHKNPSGSAPSKVTDNSSVKPTVHGKPTLGTELELVRPGSSAGSHQKATHKQTRTFGNELDFLDDLDFS